MTERYIAIVNVTWSQSKKNRREIYYVFERVLPTNYITGLKILHLNFK